MKKFSVDAQNVEADIEELHHYIIEQVQSGKFDSHLEALASYMEEHDIDMSQMSKMISPVLKQIIFDEAIVKNMVIPFNYSVIPEDYFE